jgi:Type I phosphodiesterase / nucleotide pyrophosphatase
MAIQIRWAYLKRVLAGAIFGLYMAHLLYFLNPQIDITPLRLATVTLVYGAICGLLFGTALWLLRRLRVAVFGNPVAQSEGVYRAHGFGFIVLAAFLATAIYWMHLNLFRIYLPIAAIRFLGIATNLITSVSFALLILWLFERGADRRRSRVIFVVALALIAVSSFFLYRRRDLYHTERLKVVVANVGTVAGRRPVIVVAIRNLPFDWLVTLMGEGNLHFFDQSRASAFFTRLEPFPTTSNKALWATLATGKLPSRHGVTGRFSYRTPLSGPDPNERFLLLPAGVGFRVWGLIPPVERISAQLPSGDALPFWSLFERLSFPTAVINWPSATPRSGPVSELVSDKWFEHAGGREAVFPQSLAPALAALRPSPDPAAAARFAALGARPSSRVAAQLWSDRWVEQIAESAAKGPSDAVVVSLQGLAEAEGAMRIFGNGLPDRATPRGEALRAYLEQIDQLLSRLTAAFPDHTLLVVSPSGPQPPQIPATAWSLARSLVDPEDPGADDGFVILRGRAIGHRENPQSAYTEDVVPTILFAAGLPVGHDMDGHVLSDAFSDEFLRSASLSMIPTYEAERLVVKPGGP